MLVCRQQPAMAAKRKYTCLGFDHIIAPVARSFTRATQTDRSSSSSSSSRRTPLEASRIAFATGGVYQVIVYALTACVRGSDALTPSKRYTYGSRLLISSTPPLLLSSLVVISEGFGRSLDAQLFFLACGKEVPPGNFPRIRFHFHCFCGAVCYAVPCRVVLFLSHPSKEEHRYRVRTVRTYNTCGVHVGFLDGAWSSWHLQVACLHLIVGTVCSVPFFFLASESSGRNRPLRGAPCTPYV